MSVVVAYKYAANPQDGRTRDDGSVDWSRAKPAMSDYDPIAIELGRALADDMGTELVGISIGAKAVGASMAKKNAMSKGFDRGIVVADDSVTDWNPTKTASALADLVSKIDGADIVFTGDSSIDNGVRMTGAIMAGYLQWPCFQDVVKVSKNDTGYTIVQQIPGGTRTIDVEGPVVVAATSDAVLPRVPSMKEILAAGKKPVDVIEVDELVVADAETEVTSRAKPEARERKKIVFSGEDAAVELAAALRNDGTL